MNVHTQDSIRVNDALHDFIFLDRLAWDFIDTPHFQRLRKLKQLACLEYVYPCATHTRFEHAIGTAHLAKKFLTILIKNNPTVYTARKAGMSREEVIESAVRTVTIAALLREIGHGPYSESFELAMTQQKTEEQQKAEEQLKYNREERTEQLFGLMIAHIKRQEEGRGRKWDRLSEQEVLRVKALMSGLPNDERRWEFEIINNKSNGIDAQKLDQFRRDAFYLGAKKIFIDHELLMNEARIIRNQICYPAQHIESVYNIFHSRYKLYKDYYFNVTSKAIELMLADVLRHAETHFQIRKAVNKLPISPESFLRLTDGLVDRVEHAYSPMWKEEGKEKQREGKEEQREGKEERKELGEAVDLLKRLKKRELYTFVQQITYQIREREDKRVLKWFNENLSEKAVRTGLQAYPEIIVEARDVGFGLQNANPMKKVGFFRKERTGRLQRMEENEIEKLSMLYSPAYIQRSIKLFLKTHDDTATFDSVGLDFRTFLKQKQRLFRLEFGEGESYITLGQEGSSPERKAKQNQNVGASENAEVNS